MPDHPNSGRQPFRLQLVPEEPDQVIRLQRFRLAHPDVVVQPGQFATWEATVTEADGETMIVRHTMRELLDRLGEVLP
jgi:hypothetical protein